MAALLTRHDINVNALNGFGWPPVFETHSIGVIRLLLEAKANLSLPMTEYAPEGIVPPAPASDSGADPDSAVVVVPPPKPSAHTHPTTLYHLAAWDCDLPRLIFLHSLDVPMTPDGRGELPVHVVARRICRHMEHVEIPKVFLSLSALRDVWTDMFHFSGRGSISRAESYG